MAFTVVLFAWRKPGTSPAEFKDHYENSHVPLLKSIAGSKFPLTHSRHYLARTPSENASSDNSNASHPAVAFAGTPADFEYDAFAIISFEDAAAFQEFFAVVTEPVAAAKIKADEEKFLDRPMIKIVSIDQVSVANR